MTVKIRLARGGAKKRPYYRMVVADARAPRDGDFIEKIGTYNPFLKKDDKERVTMKSDRVEHWHRDTVDIQGSCTSNLQRSKWQGCASPNAIKSTRGCGLQIRRYCPIEEFGFRTKHRPGRGHKDNDIMLTRIGTKFLTSKQYSKMENISC